MDLDPSELPLNLRELPDKEEPTVSIREGMSREIVVMLVVFLLLIPAIWLAFSSKSAGHKSKEEMRYHDAIAAAKNELKSDHLTWPEEKNALRYYLVAIDTGENTQVALRGIARISDRYLTILSRLIDYQDVKLLNTTLVGARKLLPYIDQPSYQNTLMQFQLETDQLEARWRENNQRALVKTPHLYQPLSVIQDTLHSENLAPKMVVIPAGKFVMGSPHSEPGRDVDEEPMTPIELKSFAIGQSEVTFEDYKIFAEATGRAVPDDAGWGQGMRPVINISWRGAMEYARWLSAQTGFYYRLPSEAEWEYSARAGTSTAFAYGNCLLSEQSNFDASALEAYEDCPSDSQILAKTIPVKTLKPNQWGLYNVHGNVREWVLDCWIPDYSRKPKDGSPAYLAEGGGCNSAEGKRVLRGGHWGASMRSARVANRYALDELEYGSAYGFRLVREIQ